MLFGTDNEKTDADDSDEQNWIKFGYQLMGVINFSYVSKDMSDCLVESLITLV